MARPVVDSMGEWRPEGEQTMLWVSTIARQNYASGPLRHAGGGDADVFTKSGRRTRVELRTDNMRVDDAGTNILLDVFYSVREMASNFTLLTWSGAAVLPIPADAREHTVVIEDTRNYSQSWMVLGKHHDWMDLEGVDGTVIERGQYRIDGPGDDQANAGIQLVLRVHLKYFDEQPLRREPETAGPLGLAVG